MNYQLLALYSRILLTTLLLLAAACSSARIQPVPIDGPITIDIFAARGSFSTNEFEHYRLDGDILWRECGIVVKNKDDIPLKRLSASNVGSVWLVTKGNDARIVPLRTLEKLHAYSAYLFAAAANTESLPKPASFERWSGSGMFELKMNIGEKGTSIITSLDAVADGQPAPLDKVRKLYAGLRGVGAADCRKASFFGIGREELR